MSAFYSIAKFRMDIVVVYAWSTAFCIKWCKVSHWVSKKNIFSKSFCSVRTQKPWRAVVNGANYFGQPQSVSDPHLFCADPRPALLTQCESWSAQLLIFFLNFRCHGPDIHGPVQTPPTRTQPPPPPTQDKGLGTGPDHRQDNLTAA